MASVREFRSTREYDAWLRSVGSTVRVVGVTSSKRWSLLTGFLGDAKTITVTFEAIVASAPTRPRQMGLVIAPKPVRYLAAPDQTQFTSVFARDGEEVEILEDRGDYRLIQRRDGASAWLLSTAVRPTHALEPEERPCPRCAELIKRAAKICRFCGYEAMDQRG